MTKAYVVGAKPLEARTHLFANFNGNQKFAAGFAAFWLAVAGALTADLAGTTTHPEVVMRDNTEWTPIGKARPRPDFVLAEGEHAGQTAFFVGKKWERFSVAGGDRVQVSMQEGRFSHMLIVSSIDRVIERAPVPNGKKVSP
jgi:membrane-associated phospholipid phosphatase